MKDREWCKKIEDEIADLKNRMNRLEGNPSRSDGKITFEQKVMELDIEWPEFDNSGLHFNAQKNHAVFELKEDGNYYSRDIIFNSARDTDKGTGRDLLTEYLNSEAVNKAIIDALNKGAGIRTTAKISVFLPKENQGVKNYNGVSWNYWLLPRSAGSASNFVYVSSYGRSFTNSLASAVLGCAPAFCVASRHE